MNNSGFFGLNWSDLGKGLLMAVLTPVIYIVQDSLSQGTLSFNWTAIGIAALSGGLAYLLKNLLSNSDGQFLSKEKK